MGLSGWRVEMNGFKGMERVEMNGFKGMEREW